MDDQTQPKDIRTMTKAEYKAHKQQMLRQIGTDSAAARDQKVLDALAGAKDDNERRRILRAHSR